MAMDGCAVGLCARLDHVALHLLRRAVLPPRVLLQHRAEVHRRGDDAGVVGQDVRAQPELLADGLLRRERIQRTVRERVCVCVWWGRMGGDEAAVVPWAHPEPNGARVVAHGAHNLDEAPRDRVRGKPLPRGGKETGGRGRCCGGLVSRALPRGGGAGGVSTAEGDGGDRLRRRWRLRRFLIRSSRKRRLWGAAALLARARGAAAAAAAAALGAGKRLRVRRRPRAAAREAARSSGGARSRAVGSLGCCPCR